LASLRFLDANMPEQIESNHAALARAEVEPPAVSGNHGTKIQTRKFLPDAVSKDPQALAKR